MVSAYQGEIYIPRGDIPRGDPREHDAPGGRQKDDESKCGAGRPPHRSVCPIDDFNRCHFERSQLLFITYHYPPMVFSVECVSYRSHRSRSSEACAEVGNFSAWLRAAGPEAVGLRHVRRSTIREDSDAWQPSCMPHACRMATHTYSTILSHSLGYPAWLAQHC